MNTLYKRNAKGQPIFWTCKQTDFNEIIILHGVVGKAEHREVIPATMVKVNELESRIKAKIKDGYKYLSELRDNAPENLSAEDLRYYLETYLPKFNTTGQGFILPMLAKTLEDNKPFTKGKFNGQYKINGVRCLISADKVEDNLFESIRLRYWSREGTEWTHLHWFDDYILPLLSKELKDRMVEEDIKLDGEFYIPNYTVNDINSAVKNTENPLHHKLQYWCYDIAMEDTPALSRHIYLMDNLRGVYMSHDKYEHLNNKERVIVLPNYEVTTFNQAIDIRNKFIDAGYEGLIIRNIDSEYQFGKRNSAMFKFKKIYDGYFEVVNIIPEGKRTNLPKFVLRNDINDCLFESTINVSHDKQEIFLQRKQDFIGKKAFVEYRERSGVTQVPFHAKIINVVL